MGKPGLLYDDKMANLGAFPLPEGPITSPEQDQFGRGYFADRLVRICHDVADRQDSSVTALVGPWGGGKSSVLALVRHDMVNSLPNVDQPWIVQEFLPRMNGDAESVFSNFIASVNEAIGRATCPNLLRAVGRLAISPLPWTQPNFSDAKAEASRAWRLRNLSGSLGVFAASVAPFASMLPVNVDLSAPTKALAERLQGDQSAEHKKAELAQKLRLLGHRVLITIDDIDHLPPAQQFLMFQLVGEVGNLPNLHYLLAYDEPAVLDGLSQFYPGTTDMPGRSRAQEALHKVIQRRIILPPIHREHLRQYTTNRLLHTLVDQEFDGSATERERLERCYEHCFSHYLTQPRSINRFLDHVEALCPLLAGEVNFADLTAMLFLQTQEPEVHRLIIDNVDELISHYQLLEKTPELARQKFDERRETWRKRVAAVARFPDRIDSLMYLLADLFESLHPEKYNFLSISAEQSGSKEPPTFQGIQNPAYTDRFLHLGITEFDVSDRLVRHVLLHWQDQTANQEPGLIEKFQKQFSRHPDIVLQKIYDFYAHANPLHPINSRDELAIYGNAPAVEALLSALAQMHARFLTDRNGPSYATKVAEPLEEVVRLYMSFLPEYPDKFQHCAQTILAAGGHSLLASLAAPYVPQPARNTDKEKDFIAVIAEALDGKLADLAGRPLRRLKGMELLPLLILNYKLAPQPEQAQTWLWQQVASAKWPLVQLLDKLLPVDITRWGDDTPSGLTPERINYANYVNKLLQPRPANGHRRPVFDQASRRRMPLSLSASPPVLEPITTTSQLTTLQENLIRALFGPDLGRVTDAILTDPSLAETSDTTSSWIYSHIYHTIRRIDNKYAG